MGRIVVICFGLGILLFLSSAVTASDQAKQITCTGKVVDIHARPVAGAKVVAYERSYNVIGRQEYAKLLAPEVQTDRNGNFEFTLKTNRKSYVVIVAQKADLALGWDRLPPDSAQPKINIILDEPHKISGKVVDQAGHGVAGAKIRAHLKTSFTSRLEQWPVYIDGIGLKRVTDEAGNFVFDIFPADANADFWVEAPGWGSVYRFTTHYMLSCGFEAGRTGILLELPAEETIRGLVVDANSGQGIAGINLLIKPGPREKRGLDFSPRRTISGPEGRFTFVGISAGSQYLETYDDPESRVQWATKTLEVNVISDLGAKGINVELDRGRLLELTVLEGTTRQPVSEADVSIIQQSDQPYPFYFYNYGPTNAEGKFVVRVPEGKFNITVGGENMVSVNDSVLVAEEMMVKKEILIDANGYGILTGKVFDKNKEPVAGARVRAYPSSSEVISNDVGNFHVSLDGRKKQLFLFAHDIENNLATVVDVDDDSKPMKIQLEPANVMLGKVTDNTGAGIPAAKVSLKILVSNLLASFRDEVLTDAQGRFEFRAIPSAQDSFEYRISVDAIGYGPKKYQRISIQDISNHIMELNPIALLVTDQSISGVVLDPDGQPVPGEIINVQGDNQPHRNGFTNEKGEFVIDRLTASPLRLQAGFSGPDGEAGFLNAEGGDVDLKILMGQRGTHVRQVSLLEKPLPDLKDINFRPVTLLLKNKALLICFFDMNQRPSRYCMIELANKVELLNQKGVTIVAVHASKVEKQVLDEWIAENNIPFPIGMIEGDEEKTKFDWGIKAQPWLILTDQNHIVQAEGFGVDELDTLLKNDYSFTMTMSGTPGETINTPVKVSSSGKMRIDYQGPQDQRVTNIFDLKQNKSLMILHYAKIAQYLDPPQNPSSTSGNPFIFFFHPVKNTWNLLDGTEKPLGEKQIDGQTTHGFQVQLKDKEYQNTISVWINPNSRLPVLLESIMTDSTKPDLSVKYTCSNFNFDVKFDDSLFEPPAGYQVAGLYTLEELMATKTPAKPTPTGLQIEKTLDFWAKDQKDQATQLFLQIDWTKPITFSPNTYAFSLTEKELFSLEMTEGNKVMAEVMNLNSHIRTLARHIILEQTSLSQNELAQAEHYLRSVYQFGRVITGDAESIFNVQMLGHAVTKLALKKLTFFYQQQNNPEKLRWSQNEMQKVETAVLDLRDANATLLGNFPEPKLVSLIGKSLPKFDHLQIDLPPEQLTNRIILMCFFDLNQRPSRHYLTELTKKSEQLTQKYVTVIAVQTARIDPNELNIWTTKNKITFPVGRIEGDQEKTKLTWNVKALPWFILTDQKHIVRAAGFNLDQLNQKIKEIKRP